MNLIYRQNMIVIKKYRNVKHESYILTEHQFKNYLKDSSISELFSNSIFELVMMHNSDYIDLEEFFDFIKKENLPVVEPDTICLVMKYK